MILLSYSNPSIKGTEILCSILYLSLLRPAIFAFVCNLVENLFSTLILGSVFNDYVVFYRDDLLPNYFGFLFDMDTERYRGGVSNTVNEI